MKTNQSSQQHRMSAASHPHAHRNQKLKLPSGITGFFNEAGRWICTGSQFGRRDILSTDPKEPCRLRLTRLPFIDGVYDRWGAYWGLPANIWVGWNAPSEQDILVFVRANDRDAAKHLIGQKLTNATFYR